MPVVDRGVHPAAGVQADVVAEIVVEEDQHHGVAGPEPIDDVFLEEQILLDRAGADQAEVVDPPAAEPPLHLVGEQVVLSDAVAPDERIAQHVDIVLGRRHAVPAGDSLRRKPSSSCSTTTSKSVRRKRPTKFALPWQPNSLSGSKNEPMGLV